MHTHFLPLHLEQSNAFLRFVSCWFYQLLFRGLLFWRTNHWFFRAGSARRLVSLFVDMLNWLLGRGICHYMWLSWSCSIGLQSLLFMSSRSHGMVFCMRGFCPP